MKPHDVTPHQFCDRCFVFQIQSFDFLMKILGEMPSYSGQWVKNLSVNCPGRHLVVLPLSRRAIIQYCTKILVTALKVSATCWLVF